MGFSVGESSRARVLFAQSASAQATPRRGGVDRTTPTQEREGAANGGKRARLNPRPSLARAPRAALGDEDPPVRANAALALGEFEDARTETPLAAIIEPLATALKDPDPSVRVMAASALGRMKDPRAVGHLESALEDENELVRKAAAAVLAGFRTEEPGEAPGPLDHTEAHPSTS